MVDVEMVGLVGDQYKKLMKNHTCIHNACGFMMTFHDIRPGYVFGLHTNALQVSNAGSRRGYMDKWFSTLSWMGQCSELFSIYSLMQQLCAQFFNDNDQEDINKKGLHLCH